MEGAWCEEEEAGCKYLAHANNKGLIATASIQQLPSTERMPHVVFQRRREGASIDQYERRLETLDEKGK